MERYDITRAKKSSGRIITKISSIPLLILLLLSSKQTNAQNSLLSDLRSPIIFKGNDSIAYRDPAILLHEDIFHLFYTLVKAENGLIYSYTASSKSKDLKHWSPAKIITAKNQNLNFCSPGNIIRFKDEWILSLQTYPRPGLGEKDKTRYGSADARVFIMRSKDLENWSAPELIKVKGADVKEADMGRMIDPYIVEDKDEKGKWCASTSKMVSVCPILMILKIGPIVAIQNQARMLRYLQKMMSTYCFTPHTMVSELNAPLTLNSGKIGEI